jgi:hypothetical protein
MKGSNPMFRSRFTNFTYAGSGFPGGAARRSLTRAASLAAITVLMLGTVSGPAVAQIVRDHRTHSGGTSPTQPAANANTTPLRAFFTKLTCTQESDDNTWPFPDHDEPYLVIFAADLRGGTAKGAVFGSQIFYDTDTNETKTTSLQFWSLDGSSGSPIGSDDDYIILAQLMESDQRPGDDYYQELLGQVKSLIPKLQAYKQAGMSRATMESLLRTDMDLVIETVLQDEAAQSDIANGSPFNDPDDRIGGVFGILWGTEWLPVARSGQTVTRSARLVGNGSSYNLEFQLRP